MFLKHNAGFTLIELSIVLVIIGLLVGGVLVGQDLIQAAETRATIAQIEKYNTAVHTFQTQYNGLPGDLANAGEFGFDPRQPYPGEGDGNGIIEGVIADGSNPHGGYQSGGETVMFWKDLSQASLIDGAFSAASPSASTANITGGDLDKYFPKAKLGRGNYIYVYSGGLRTDLVSEFGTNFFGMGAIIDTYGGAGLEASATIPVMQAYNIDTKMDDGFPVSGGVIARYHAINEVPYGAAGGVQGAIDFGNGKSTPKVGTSCYDNNGTPSVIPTYTVSNGQKPNCALSFRFQ